MIGSDIITFLLALAFIVGCGIGGVIGYSIAKAEDIADKIFDIQRINKN